MRLTFSADFQKKKKKIADDRLHIFVNKIDLRPSQEELLDAFYGKRCGVGLKCLS
jgi:hypothetical protein